MCGCAAVHLVFGWGSDAQRTQSIQYLRLDAQSAGGGREGGARQKRATVRQRMASHVNSLSKAAMDLPRTATSSSSCRKLAVLRGGS